MQIRLNYSNAEHNDTSITVHVQVFPVGAFLTNKLTFWCQMTH